MFITRRNKHKSSAKKWQYLTQWRFLICGILTGVDLLTPVRRRLGRNQTDLKKPMPESKTVLYNNNNATAQKLCVNL